MTTSRGERIGLGDRVATRRNDPGLGVANRQTWTVAGIGEDGSLNLRGRGRDRVLPAEYANRFVELAYATTVHGAQGETVDRAHVAIGDTTGAAAAYVAMTRGRDGNTAHLVAETVEDARRQWVEVFARDRADLGPAHAKRQAIEAIDRYGSQQRRRPAHWPVESWIKQMNAAGLAPGTIKTRYVNVRSVFRAAVKDRVIGSDPTDGVRLPRGRRADVAMSIPAPEEVGQLMAAADEGFAPFIALCAFAGLRLGEAAGVQLGDIDFLRKSLKVSRQVQRINGGAIDVRAPKYGSERVVYLADSLVNLLAEHVSAHGTTGKDRWLFAGEGDDPPHQNTVGYWWRKTLRDAGLSGIKLHDLWHFYASGLIAAGCDVVTVQRSLGHAKATTTLNTYAHLWPTAEDRTRKAAGSIMSAALDHPVALANVDRGPTPGRG